MTVTQLAGTLDEAAPYPVPAGRGRWKLTLHSRVYVGGGYATAGAPWQSTLLAELSQARSRRLERSWNRAATLTFTVDGRDPIATAIRELQTDVYAWRWNDWTGADVCVFHGVVDHAEDELSEQSHVTVYGAHDYLAMLERRRLHANMAPTLFEQDLLVEQLVRAYGVNAQTAGGASFLPGSWLPLFVVLCNPAGGARSGTGQNRTRQYLGGAQVSQLLDDLANVVNGFDYDVLPAPAVPAGLAGYAQGPIPANVDALRIFYPAQGVPRADMALVFGGNVAHVTRTVSSADYANRIYGVGNKASSDPLAPQLVSDQSNASASGTAGGLWVDVLNAPDVSVQATLTEQTAGALALEGQLIPTYTVGLRPGCYRYGYPNIGDVVPVIVQSGRLNVEDDQRVMAIAYDIGDDGDEDVSLTVGRAPNTLGGIFRDTKRTLDALNRK